MKIYIILLKLEHSIFFCKIYGEKMNKRNICCKVTMMNMYLLDLLVHLFSLSFFCSLHVFGDRKEMSFIIFLFFITLQSSVLFIISPIRKVFINVISL